MPTEPQTFCMSITPFKTDGSLDEPAFRAHLQRMAEAGVGLYFASPGSGEGHTLSLDELRQVYRIGVEVCKGKVETRANLPESRNVEELLGYARIAQEEGVDVIQIYSVDPGHGMIPSEREQEMFYRSALDAIDYPLSLSVNVHAVNYSTPIGLLKRLCADYPNVGSINVLQPPTAYLVELMEAVGPKIAFFVRWDMLGEALILGAQGSMSGHPNVVPYLVRSIGRHFVDGDIEKCRRALRDLFRLGVALDEFGRARQTGFRQWAMRWMKPGMTVFNLPGHSNGLMRPPTASMSAGDIEALGEVLRGIGLWEAEQRAREELS